ncbi:MAG: transposase [Solirubrobacterales bacterium]
MARKPRENVEGGVYHVYARGNGGAPVYLDDDDRRFYLLRLGRVTSSVGWRCLSYCLMSNHVHLLLETPHANLSNGMQRLQGGYAQAFNKRRERTGHLFEGRYGAVRSVSDEQLLVTAAYIARNPVDAGLCREPAQWSWSSYRAVLAGIGPPWLDQNRLLRYFGGGAEARQRYSDFVHSSVAGV